MEKKSELIDLTGKQFGMLTVMYRIENSKSNKSRWHCKCDCGNECDTFGYYLKCGDTKSCGCLKHKTKCDDITGQKFGMLTVLYRVENSNDGRAKWHCGCDCGNEVDVIGKCLKSGHTKSCGCLSSKSTSKYNSENKIKKNDYVIADNCIIAKTSNGTEFLIDKDDEWIFEKYCWHTSATGHMYAFVRGKNTDIKLHRLIMNCPDDMVVDHINGNPLDNRKSNLRVVTQQQNMMNQKQKSNNKSGFTGVFFDKNAKKWNASIAFNNERVYLGRFDNFDDAVSARKVAEEKYFGEYSCYNSRLKNKENIINEEKP